MGKQLKYDQARLSILNIIVEDALKPGDKLKTERQLLQQIACSRITLRKALEALEREGMIERHVSKGTFLKKAITLSRKTEKIVFIHVTSDTNAYISGAMMNILETFFETANLDFKYLRVPSFSEKVLASASGALGIMLYGSPCKEFIELLNMLHIPIVLVGNVLNPCGLPQVCLNIVQCAKLVTETLIKRGACNLALINSDPGFYMTEEILYGFTAAMKEHGLSPDNVFAPEYNDRQDFMDSFIPSMEDFDAVVMETGNYFAFLSSCRINGFFYSKRIGVLPYYDEIINHVSEYLFRGGKNTIFGKAEDSLQLRAASILLEHLIHAKELKSVALSSLIHDSDITPSQATGKERICHHQ